MTTNVTLGAIATVLAGTAGKVGKADTGSRSACLLLCVQWVQQ